MAPCESLVNYMMILTFRIEQTKGTIKRHININKAGLQASHLLINISTINHGQKRFGIKVHPLWPKFTKELDGGVKPRFSTTF